MGLRRACSNSDDLFFVCFYVHQLKENEGGIMTYNYIRAIMSAGTVEEILAEEDMKPLSKSAVSSKLTRKIEAGESVSRLAALRMSRGMTQVQLAEQSGIAQSTIARLERGIDGKSIEKMTMINGYALAKALRCRMEDLLDPEKCK